MSKPLQDYDWTEIQAALYAYAKHVIEREPRALHKATLFNAAADECPSPEDF